MCVNVIVVVMLRQALFLSSVSFFFIHNRCCCFLVTVSIAIIGLLGLRERREPCAYASCGVCRVHSRA
jgi:hypothetical protein